MQEKNDPFCGTVVGRDPFGRDTGDTYRLTLQCLRLGKRQENRIKGYPPCSHETVVSDEGPPGRSRMFHRPVPRRVRTGMDSRKKFMVIFRILFIKIKYALKISFIMHVNQLILTGQILIILR